MGLAVPAAALALTVGAFPANATPSLAYGSGPLAHYPVSAQPLAGHCHYRYTRAKQPLPDPHCTPGALNPRVTQRTISTTICRAGYSASIRPPASVTAAEKRADAKSYGYRGSLRQAEYDHLVSLELGGDPNDARNLWVEPPSPGHRVSQGFRNPKDTVENKAHSLVCRGIVPLRAMQVAIASNWTTALAAVGHPLGR